MKFSNFSAYLVLSCILGFNAFGRDCNLEVAKLKAEKTATYLNDISRDHSISFKSPVFEVETINESDSQWTLKVVIVNAEWLIGGQIWEVVVLKNRCRIVSATAGLVIGG